MSKLSKSKMAEDALFQEDRCSTGAGQQGENPQHHERALLTCDSVGMGGQESHYQRSAKCEKAESARRSNRGGDCGDPGRAAQPSSHDDRTGCLHWTPSRRTHRVTMGGCGLRGARSSRPQIGRRNGGGCAENGSVSKGRSVGRANRTIVVLVETDLHLSRAAELGLRLARDEGQATILAHHAMALLRQTCTKEGGGHEEHELAHVSAHVRGTPEGEWRESEGCAGTTPSRQSKGDDRRLHAGGQSAEAGNTKQIGADGTEENRVRVAGPNWTMKKNGGVSEFLCFVGVPEGFEPVLPR